MENQDVFTGKLVRLVAADLEADCKLLAEWDRDSEYQRLLNSERAVRFNARQTQTFFDPFVVATLQQRRVDMARLLKVQRQLRG